MEGVGHSLAMGEVTLKPLLEDARRIYTPGLMRFLRIGSVKSKIGVFFQ